MNVNNCPSPEGPARGFANEAAARAWAAASVRWYNHEHRHSGNRHVTPAERDDARDQGSLARRDAVYLTGLAA